MKLNDFFFVHAFKRRASVALISLLVISAFTLILVVAMSEVNINSAYQRLNVESSKTSYYAAEACFEEAMHRLEMDTSFLGTTLELDSNTTCSITISGAGPYDVLITVNHYSFEETYEAKAVLSGSTEGNNLFLTDWQEL